MLKIGDKVRVIKNEYDEDAERANANLKPEQKFEGKSGTVVSLEYGEGEHQLVLVNLPEAPCRFDDGWALYARELEVI